MVETEEGIRVWLRMRVRKVWKVQEKGWRVIAKNVGLGGVADIVKRDRQR